MTDGARLKLLRTGLGLTQLQLARQVLSNQTEISLIETGDIDLDLWSKQNPDRWNSLKSALKVEQQAIELKEDGDRWVAMVPRAMSEVCDRLPVGLSVVLV